MERKIVQIVANEMDVETGLWRLLGLGNDGVVYAATDSGTGWEVFRPALGNGKPTADELLELNNLRGEIVRIHKELDKCRRENARATSTIGALLSVWNAAGRPDPAGDHESMADTLCRWCRAQREMAKAYEAWMRDACAWIEGAFGFALNEWRRVPSTFAGARALIERCPAQPTEGGAE